MIHRWAVLAAALFFSSSASATMGMTYVQYISSPRDRIIRVQSAELDPELSEFRADESHLFRKSLFLPSRSSKGAEFSRQEFIGRHYVDTRLSLVQKGLLEIHINGVKKVSCHFGPTLYGGIVVREVAVDLGDGTIWAMGHMGDRPFQLQVPLYSPRIITDIDCIREAKKGG